MNDLVGKFHSFVTEVERQLQWFGSMPAAENVVPNKAVHNEVVIEVRRELFLLR